MLASAPLCHNFLTQSLLFRRAGGCLKGPTPGRERRIVRSRRSLFSSRCEMSAMTLKLTLDRTSLALNQFQTRDENDNTTHARFDAERTQ